MNYIFVSAYRESLDPLSGIGINDLSFCSFGKGYLSEFHYKSRNKKRIVDCYSFNSQIDDDIEHDVNSINVFHGYLLGGDDSRSGGKKLNPENCYYGVYSHAKITEENCCFATDELGLSPLYYSKECGYTFISNNINLIAFYKLRLGIKIYPEKTLPIWHTVGLTIGSENTGYENIYRLRPWRYIAIDCQDNINFPSKMRVSVPDDYEEACDACIQELRMGMKTIKDRYLNLHSQLTGGFDSRLVLSFILDAKFHNEFVFSTVGDSKIPDVIIANMLAEKFDLNHQQLPSKIAGRDFDFEEFCRRAEQLGLYDGMEAAFVENPNPRFGIPSTSVVLTGMGAIFAKSLDYAAKFEIFMKRNFKGENIDFSELTQAQYEYGYNCFGYANADKAILTDEAFELSDNNMKYIFEFGYAHFPENMYYADSMSAYKYRTHNARLSTSESNCVFLYSPTVIETSRKLAPKLRQEAKLYFDIMWRLNQEICFFPYENRVCHPGLYEKLPLDIKNKFSEMTPMVGDVNLDEQKSSFDVFFPFLRKDLVNMLPESVFSFIKKDALEMRLNETTKFAQPAYILLNLFAIAKWHETISDLNRKYLKKPQPLTAV